MTSTKQNRPPKWSKTQQEVLDLLASGWELGVSKSVDGGRCWVQEGGVGCGGQSKTISASTFGALWDRGVLRMVESTHRVDKYALDKSKL